MTFDNKRVLSIALATALLGGTVGAFVSRSYKSGETSATTTQPAPTTTAQTTAEPATTATEPTATTDQLAQNNPDYRNGFVDGMRTVLMGGKDQAATRTVAQREGAAPSRVVYRNSGRSNTVARSNNQRVYYDYEQPRKRSFWQKHRDKLTLAAGTGGGALIGGLIGGKKGAAIGALAGGGGSALYTYKLRKRNRNY